MSKVARRSILCAVRMVPTGGSNRPVLRRGSLMIQQEPGLLRQAWSGKWAARVERAAPAERETPPGRTRTRDRMRIRPVQDSRTSGKQRCSRCSTPCWMRIQDFVHLLPRRRYRSA